MKKNVKKKIAGLMLAAVLSGTWCFASLAVGPAASLLENGEENARLMDHTVEWDEVETLVKYWNPTYCQYADTAEGFVNDLDSGRREDAENLEKSIDTIDQNLEEIRLQREKLSGLPGSMVIDARGTTVDQTLAMLSQTEAYLKESRQQAKKGIQQLDNQVHMITKTYDDSLKPVRDQITRVVEGLMVSYHQLLVNRQLVEKQIALYEAMAQTQADLQGKDLATQAAVASADAQLQEARATLLTVDNGLTELKRAIGMQTGYAAEDPPEIGPVPVPDPAKYDGIDVEAARKQAFDNNKELESVSDLKNYKGSGALVERDGAANQKKAELSGKFDKIYASLMEQKLLYASAQTSLRRAQLTRDQAKRQYALGLLGRAEYLGRELECLSCEAAVSNASLSFAQAANTYEWALKGAFD